MEIAEEISRAYLNDGAVSVEELNSSFAKLQDEADKQK
jgi:hypothetical protein